MASQVDKEATIHANPHFQNGKPTLEHQPNSLDCHATPSAQGKETEAQKLNNEKLFNLLQTFHHLPLIPNETALSLLKIQSKYVSSHPCMCTSRFRHTLHQLDEEHHQDLDNLCSQLPYILKIEDDEIIDRDSLYNSVIPSVFGDLNALQLKSDDWLIRSGQQKCELQDLTKNLNKIIARLVTDYRAIFAIEVEFSRSFEKSDDEFHNGHTLLDHHRKRHEEVDSCPEEIKQMKVACAELTLECKSTADTMAVLDRYAGGPKFCLKSLTSQEIPEKDNSILRHPVEQHNTVLEDTRSRQRRNNHRENNKEALSSLSNTVKAAANSSCEVVAAHSSDSTPGSSDVEQSPSPLKLAMRFCQRKRKERRDSIGEVQDKKFSKSSSDVFTPQTDQATANENCAKNCDNRRAHSTSDFVDIVQSSCQDIQTFCTPNPEVENQKKCIFYVSDDEAPDTIHERPIMRPRRSRKVRNDSLKENTEQKIQPEEEQPKSVLPWKKDIQPKVQSFLPKTPSPTSTVLKLVTSLKSSMYDNTEAELSSSSGSSTTSEDIDDSSSNSSTNSFSVKAVKKVEEAEAISWQPYGRWSRDEDVESTRHFGILNSKQHLDRNLHWSRSGVIPETDLILEQRSKLKKLTKQLSVVKRKVEDFEATFEDNYGYRPSVAEKQNNKAVRKMLIQMSRLKRQIRLCRESGDSGIIQDEVDATCYDFDRPLSPSDFANVLNVYSDSSNDASRMAFDMKNKIKDIMNDIEDHLACDREVTGRPFKLEDMTHEQVIQEKNCIQGVLNQFQSVLNQSGNASEEEKATLRDLMTRYRTVKRLIRRSSNLINKEANCELETIPEGSEIQLTLASPQHRINIEMNNGQGNLSPSRMLEYDKAAEPSLPYGLTSDEQNLHAMSRVELLNVQRAAKEEKKLLKRWIKEREVKFLDNFGRSMPKEEIKVHENYARYKMTKAKLKLVDALLSKYHCNIPK